VTVVTQRDAQNQAVTQRLDSRSNA
jgi:hypothetical protein